MVLKESLKRGYHFDKNKINAERSRVKIWVTSGQIDFELKHLKNKLKDRDRLAHQHVKGLERPSLHPLFKRVKGDIEVWERATKKTGMKTKNRS